MDQFRNSLNQNAKLLRARISKQALFGLAMGLLAIIVATIADCYVQYGYLSINNLILTQKNNVALWFLDISPFFFSFWGQYINSVIAYEASAMIFDETHDLQVKTSSLEAKLSHDYTHDSLTGLPNQILFMDRVNQALNTLRHEKMKLAICLIDVSNLKEVNNSLGRYNGDRILKQLSVRLSGVAREPNTIARLSENTFALLLLKVTDNNDVYETTKKIHNALLTPFVMEDLSLNIQANIGIVLSPEHGVDADILIQRAEIAMQSAKNNNKDNVVYSTKLDTNNQRHLILVNDLRAAIKHQNLSIYYQPQINLHSGVISLEALVRWNHPQFGLMPPDDFIPLAERNGLCTELSFCIINMVLQQASHWHQQGKNIKISINLSVYDLADVDLPDRIAGQLAGHAVPAENLILELTESAIMSDKERSLQILSRLVEFGMQISIDDFGMGYSSLSYLSKLPASELKIDKSFVMDMFYDKNEIIVRAIIDLAHNLGLQVVAEGVKNKEIFNHLKSMGCDSVQGYHIAQPMGVTQLEDWLVNSPWVRNTN